MADNVDITPGTGKTIATDEVTDGTLGTVQVQYVKLMDGALNGTSKAGVDASGLAVKPAAQEAHIGEVGGKSTLVSPTLTISTSVYTAGDVVDTKHSMTALRVNDGTALLESLLVIDKSNQKSGFDIYFFDSSPGAGTYTDNAAVVFSTDLTKLIGRISVSANDYVTQNSIAVAHIKGIGAVLKGAGGDQNLHIVIVVASGSSPTYTGTGDLIMRYGYLND